MKATGIVRRIDDLGRVVIPKELRRVFEIKEGDPLEIFVDGNGIILRKYAPGCVLCGETDAPIAPIYPDKLICTVCVDKAVRDQAKHAREAVRK